MKYQLNIRSNEGYSADQVNGITKAELIDALADLEDDDEVITYDLNNAYGAKYGRATMYVDLCELESEDE